MNRSTIFALLLGGTLLPSCLAQDVAQAAAQPVPGQQAAQVAQPDNSFEHEPNTPAPRREISKSSSKRSSVVTRARGAVPEVRTFTFSNDAFGGPRTPRPLMIRSSRADAKAMGQLSEDLAVMTRVLDKALAEHSDGFHPPKAAGIDILTLASGTGNSGRAMYVDDYGVIFALNVNMPLKPEPKAEEVDQKEPTRRGVWEETWNELYGQQRRRAKRWAPAGGRAFDQGEVDALKASLIEAMRSATNIRHLKPNDMIAVVVRGTPLTDERQVAVQVDGNPAEAPVVEETADAESTLVLRTTKIELDKGIAGKDSGDLRRSVRISVY